MLEYAASPRALRDSLSPAELGFTRVRPHNYMAEVGNIRLRLARGRGVRGGPTSRSQPPRPTPLPYGEREQAVPRSESVQANEREQRERIMRPRRWPGATLPALSALCYRRSVPALRGHRFRALTD